MEEQRFPPIFFLTLAYIFGIILANFLKIPLFIPLVLIFGSIAFLALFYWRSSRFNLFLSFLLLSLLGITLSTLTQISMKESLLLKLAKKEKEITVWGKVIKEPQTQQNQIVFPFEVNLLKEDQETRKVKEFTLVLMENPKNLSLEPGKRLKLKGTLLRPQNTQGNPFNYQKYLYRQKIQTFLKTNFQKIENISPPSSPLVSLANLSRQKIKEGASFFSKKDQAGLFLGILIGDTSQISEKLEEDFRKTGLTHILAVSGMNVGMLLLACFFILKFLKVRPLFQALFIIITILLYTLITQSQPSILRASLMSTFSLGAWLLGRKGNLLAALSVAALTLLIYDPFLLYNVSFQLSFAATLAIVLFFPTLKAKFQGLPRGVRDLVAVSLAAQLGVAPFLIYYFKKLSLISLLANILVVPLTFPILSGGLLSSFLSPFLGKLVFPFYFLLSFLLSFIIRIAHFLATLPGAAIVTKPFSFFGLFYFSLLGGAVLFRKREKLKFPGGFILILFLTLLAGGLLWQFFQGTPPKGLEVTFFDVGQGDSTLIQTPEGKNILVDGGGSSQVLREKLAREGLGKFDLVILSHPHLDHVGGLVEVVKNYPTSLVLDSGQPHTSFRYREFLESIKKRNIPYKVGRKGQKFTLGKDLKISVLGPEPPLITGSDSDLNNNSLVIKVTYGNFSLLLPGDAQIEAEKRLLTEGESLEAVFLKIPHQGSRDASYFPFLKKVQPQVALIFVGKDNPYGHPAKSTILKLKALGVKTYRTDENGDVKVTSDGRTFKVSLKK